MLKKRSLSLKKPLSYAALRAIRSQRDARSRKGGSTLRRSKEKGSLKWGGGGGRQLETLSSSSPVLSSSSVDSARSPPRPLFPPSRPDGFPHARANNGREPRLKGPGETERERGRGTGWEGFRRGEGITEPSARRSPIARSIGTPLPRAREMLHALPGAPKAICGLGGGAKEGPLSSPLWEIAVICCLALSLSGASSSSHLGGGDISSGAGMCMYAEWGREGCSEPDR